MSDSLRDAMARGRALAGQTLDGDKSFFDEVGGIPRNIIENTLSIFGVDKSPEQLAYEAKYPISSFLTGMISPLGVYGAAYKGLSGVKKISTAIDKIQFAGSPIKTAMGREAAKIGAIETARLGVGAVIPEGEPLEDMFADSVLNIGLTAGGVGAFKLLSSGGKRNAPLQEMFAGVDLDASPQVQIRQLQEKLATNTVDSRYVNEARNRVAKLEENVRTDAAEKYVGPTLNSGGKRLSKLFHTKGDQGGTVRRRLARTSDGFRTDADWQAAATSAGLPADWLKFAQYPRHVSFRAEKAAERTKNTVYQTMKSAGDGWYVTREQNDGLFVMAKRIRGIATKPEKTDEWLVFKTDTPGHFRPGSSAWQQQVADHNLFLAKVKPVAGDVSPVFNSARDMLATLPLRKYVGLGSATGTVAQMGQKITKLLGAEGALKNTGEMTKRVSDFVTHYLAPTVQQFGRSPRAGRVMAIATATNDAAEALTREIVYGTKSLDPGKTAFAHLLRGSPDDFQGDSIQAALQKLDEKDVTDFWGLWKEQATPDVVNELYAKGSISAAARDFALKAQEIDDKLVGMIGRTEDATGQKKLTPKAGHFGLSRTWEGDLRVAVRDPEGRLIGVAAGQSRVSAQKAADKLVEQLEAQGKAARRAEEFDITETINLPRDLKPHVSSPAWVLERQGLAGYKNFDKPFTKQELLEAYASGVRRRAKYMANLSTTNLLADDIAKVSVEDPLMHRILVERLDDLAGKRSPLTKLQDQVVDTVLSPVMGKNTASTIVSTTNKLMWHLELGALRIAYPALNMLTFIQTVLPEAAFVGSASEDVLKKYYTTYGVRGPNARPMGVLDPIKMWARGTKQMHAKGDAGWTRAVKRGINDGVLDPRFIEESVGQTSATATNWAGAVKEKGLVGLVTAVSEYLPAQSEKWARLNSFATAHAIGKDVLGLVDEDVLYKFSKDFTDRTMFRYGMEARPRIFTTPAGSALGLFKNWMMHYMGIMADYTGEGVLRGNWAPLLWQTAGTAALGGLAATPLYGVANGLSEALSGKSALVGAYDAMGWAPDGVSDAIMYGLPAGISGISLSGASQAPLSNPMRDATQMFSFVHADRANALGKALGGALGYMEAVGQNPLSDPNTRDMFARAVAPKTIYRMMQTTEDEAIKSLSTGNPVIKDVGVMDKVLFGAGFNPVKLEKAYAVADELWRDQAKMRKAVQTMGEAMSHAYARGDQKEINQIVQNALALGVDLSSVERSALSRLSKAESDIITRGFKPDAVAERLAVLGDSYEMPAQ